MEQKAFKELVSEVEKHFKEHFEELEDKRIHFASRLYLWNKDRFAAEKLRELKKGYIGETEQEIECRLRGLLEGESEDLKNCVAKNRREVYFKQYPRLKGINKVLFRNLLCKTLYGLDLGKIIKKIVDEQELLGMKKAVESDRDAMLTLSTHAVNFLYLLDFYRGGEREYGIAPAEYLKMVEVQKGDTAEDVRLKIYFLTHCIIGESLFYARRIKRNKGLYLEMVRLVERMIEANFSQVSMDNKFEFLVCARLCGYGSKLKDSIFEEAEKSISEEGRYFIDRHNAYCRGKDSLRVAEHRNVLAIMASKDDTLD